jgi:soluble lytic murein transglycosylase-like protein
MRNFSHFSCVFFLVALFLSDVARADIFGFVDENGVRNYTDIPTDRRARLLWRDLNGPKAIFLYKFPPALLPEVEAAARAHSIDPLLLKALVSVESRANPKARSPKGAMGLTQLMPATAKRYGVGNAYDPRQNLNGGARYLRDLLTLFRDDVHLALAAFNAGENAVIRNGNRIPPYEETQRYVPAVLEQMAIFRRQGSPKS